MHRRIVNSLMSVATGSGGLMLLQNVPAVPIPADLRSWPATGILGLVCMTSLAITFFVVRHSHMTAQNTAKALGELSSAMRESGTRQDEMCQKMGDMTREQTEQRVTQQKQFEELLRRPCFASINPRKE
jgi:hypothetical protein